MYREGQRWILTGMGLVMCWCCTPAGAQDIAVGQTAFGNLRGARASQRVPGNMVRRGFDRAQTAVLRPGAVVEITMTEPLISARQQLRSELVDIIIADFMETVAFLVNRLFARAGLPAILPTGFLAPGGDNGDGGGDTGDGGDDSSDDSVSGGDSISGDERDDRGGRGGRG